jgi:hypothetical protein
MFILSNNNNNSFLDLSHGKLRSKNVFDVNQFLNGLKTQPNLWELTVDLSYNELYCGEIPCVIEILNRLRSQLPNLCRELSVNLSYNKIGSKGFYLLMDQLIKKVPIKKLNLSNNLIGEEVSKKLADTILQRPYLEELNLESCFFSNKTVNRLASALCNNPFMTLHLNNNPGITKDWNNYFIEQRAIYAKYCQNQPNFESKKPETIPTVKGFSTGRQGASRRSVYQIHENGEEHRQQNRKFIREVDNKQNCNRSSPSSTFIQNIQKTYLARVIKSNSNSFFYPNFSTPLPCCCAYCCSCCCFKPRSNNNILLSATTTTKTYGFKKRRGTKRKGLTNH